MKQGEFEDFSALITDVLAFYKQDASTFAISVWWQACSGFEFEQVSKALTAHAMDAERGQFSPKPADIVRKLAGTPTDRAMLAWGKVHDAMGRVGAYSDVVFDDPAIHAVIEDLGGWPKVCRTELKDLSFIQHRFQEAHRAYASTGQHPYPRLLCGDRSPDHEYERRGLPIPKPVVVGNVAQARLVYKGGSTTGKLQITTFQQSLPRPKSASDVAALKVGRVEVLA